MRDFLFLEKREHVDQVKSPVKTENSNIHVKVIDYSQKFLDILNL